MHARCVYLALERVGHPAEAARQRTLLHVLRLRHQTVVAGWKGGGSCTEPSGPSTAASRMDVAGGRARLWNFLMLMLGFFVIGLL
mmetsp:Transcript_27419/g.76632  ORF Transcript_27419/g.76632 Transcript_27419/m.76632 type:complete len:85 (-) Transcript_27419:1419-1673(-)